MPAPREPITACILTLNEADRLPATLSALAGRVDRILIHDAGSTDGTRAVAEAAGAGVEVHDWPGYVAARRRLLAAAATEWVLMIDADEVVEAGVWGELERRGFPEPGVAAYALRRRTHYLGRTLNHAWQPDWKPALLRRGAVRIAGGSVHERVEVDGPTERLAAGIVHHSYRSLRDHYERILRYGRLAAADLHAAGRRARPWDLTLRPAWHVFRQLVLKGAVLDGVRGWLAAMSAGINAFVRYAMLYELQVGGDAGPGTDGGGSEPAP